MVDDAYETGSVPHAPAVFVRIETNALVGVPGHVIAFIPPVALARSSDP